VRNAYKILITKPEGKRPLHRFMHKYEDNVKMAFKGIRYNDVA
jgi:hypothetical protein